jgi:hypothetical protein
MYPFCISCGSWEGRATLSLVDSLLNLDVCDRFELQSPALRLRGVVLAKGTINVAGARVMSLDEIGERYTFLTRPDQITIALDLT